MEKCTFRPHVNPKSTRIAYRQVVEMHLGQKEFTKTYMTIDDQGRESENHFANVPEIKADQNTGSQTARVNNRINHFVEEFVTDKLSGKRQDVPTEQIEYDKSVKELSFKPNIAKSQLSMQLALKRSPVQTKIEQSKRKSPSPATKDFKEK